MAELAMRLIEKGLVTSGQLNSAEKEASKNKKSVWSALIKLGYLSEEDMTLFFAQESGITYVRVSEYKVDEEVVRLLHETFCRQHILIPLFQVKETLYVACSNPLDTMAIDDAAKMSGCTIEPLVACVRSIKAALDEYFGPPDEDFMIEKLVFRQPPLQGITFKRESERLALNIPAVLTVLDKSVALRASSRIEGYTRNISASGAALSLRVLLFLPKGINIALELKPEQTIFKSGAIIKTIGEIIYCNMEQGKHYLVGIKFKKIEHEELEKLIKLASSEKKAF